MTSKHARLRILHTNDIHSHFEQMPRIASMLEKLRGEAGAEHTLTLDIGDHMDRMRPETEGSGGAANVEVLRQCAYDAVTLGNNEGLTFTADTLAARYGGRGPGFRVVLANLLEQATGRCPAWAEPSAILLRAGVRIGLIGVTAAFSDFYRLLGWDAVEPLGAVAELARCLRPQVDVLIVMSHLGIRHDERMAQEIPGIDVILGAHTHHLLDPPQRIGGTLVCAAGKFGQHVGVVDLIFEEGALLQAEGRVLAVADAGASDEETARLIARHAEAAERQLHREVARLERGLEADWFAESPLGNVLAAGLRRWTGAELGLVNAGQLLGGLPQGPVTEAQLLRLCPSPINPCRVRLTGSRLLQALEESLLPEFMNKPLYGFGFRGKVLGTLCVDGMSVDYDPDGPPLRRITAVRIGGSPLEADREYDVGTIDMFTFRIGYVTLGEGREPEYFLPEFLRDVLSRELNDPAVLQEGFSRRWHPLPGSVQSAGDKIE